MPLFTQTGEIPRVSYDIGKFITPVQFYHVNSGTNTITIGKSGRFHVVSVRQEIVLNGIGQVKLPPDMYFFRGYDIRDNTIHKGDVLSFVDAHGKEIWCHIYGTFSQSEKGQFVSFYGLKTNKPHIQAPIITHLNITHAKIKDLTDTVLEVDFSVPFTYNPKAKFEILVNGAAVIPVSMNNTTNTHINFVLPNSIKENDRVTIKYVSGSEKILSSDGQAVELTSLLVNVMNKVKAPIVSAPHMLHARVMPTDLKTVVMTYNEDLKGSATAEAFTIHGGANDGLHLASTLVISGKELHLTFANDFILANDGNVSMQIIDNLGNFTLEGTNKAIETQTYNVDLSAVPKPPVAPLTFTIDPLTGSTDVLKIVPSDLTNLIALKPDKIIKAHLKVDGKVSSVNVNMDIRGSTQKVYGITLDASQFMPKNGVVYEVGFATNPFVNPIDMAYIPITNNIPAVVLPFFEEKFDTDTLAKYTLTPARGSNQGTWTVAGGEAKFHLSTGQAFATVQIPLKAGLGHHFKLVIETNVGAVIQDIYFKSANGDCPDIAVSPANWNDINIYFGAGSKAIKSPAITDPSTTGLIECEIDQITGKCVINGFAFDLPNKGNVTIIEPNAFKIGLKNDAVFKTITLYKL